MKSRLKIALYSPTWKMFIKMNSNGTMGCSPLVENGVFPRGWKSEIFELIPLNDGEFALWSPIWKMFIKMNSNGTMGCSPLVKDGVFPRGWESEIFKLIPVDRDGFAFWSPIWKMFIKMNINGTMSCSPLVESGAFPRGRESEIFNIVFIEDFKSEKKSHSEILLSLEKYSREKGEKEKMLRENEKERLKLIKIQEKALEKKAEAEKKKAKEEESRKHKLKASRGETFCHYCGKDENDLRGDEFCYGREYGHTYIYMKDRNDRWKLKCNKCGRRVFESHEGCL